jgi:hypothetical protein
MAAREDEAAKQRSNGTGSSPSSTKVLVKQYEQLIPIFEARGYQLLITGVDSAGRAWLHAAQFIRQVRDGEEIDLSQFGPAFPTNLNPTPAPAPPLDHTETKNGGPAFLARQEEATP